MKVCVEVGDIGVVGVLEPCGLDAAVFFSKGFASDIDDYTLDTEVNGIILLYLCGAQALHLSGAQKSTSNVS